MGGINYQSSSNNSYYIKAVLLIYNNNMKRECTQIELKKVAKRLHRKLQLFRG